jgi:hypothetical protein
MELEEDYGDITHKHTHLHFQPEPYKKTIDTALKDWCMEILDEGEAEEKCKELNQSFFNDLLTGSTDEIDMSKIYMYLSQLPNLKGSNKHNEIEIEIEIENTEIVLKIIHSPEDKKINIYREEIKYMLDLDNQELFAIFYLKSEDYNGLDTKIVKIKLENDKFTLQKMGSSGGITEYNYSVVSNNLITNFKTELKKINLNQLMLENEETMEGINEQKEKINKRKISKPDVITGKRRLDNLEKWDEDILKELFGLTTYLIIGISFGIYCIYNFFVLELK